MRPIEIAVFILNEALAADPKATNELFAHRVFCNRALADHPTIQVRQLRINPSDDTIKATDVGVIGILNGVLEAMTGERVAMQIDDDGKLLGFQVYEPPTPDES